MAWKGLNNKGKEVTLLNPSEKASKYAKELKNKKRYTNDGKTKTDKQLTKEGSAYRSGYLKAIQDSNNAFIAKHPRYQHKTEGGKRKGLWRKNKGK